MLECRYTGGVRLMVWFKVDDGLPTSRKVLSIPKRRRAAAIGVWTLAGAWSAGELTNGYVPDYALEEIPSGPQYAPDLVACGLWRRVSKGSKRSAIVRDIAGTSIANASDSIATPIAIELESFPNDGFVFHDWDDYQRSKEEVLQEREFHAARQKAYRERVRAKRDADRDASRVTPGDASRVTPRDAGVTAPIPDPTRPDPTVVPTELPSGGQTAPQAPPPKSSRGHRIPTDFEVTDAMRKWAQETTPGVDVGHSTEKFRNHFKAVPGAKGLMLDWEACWRNWILGDFSKLPTDRQQNYDRKPGQRRVNY